MCFPTTAGLWSTFILAADPRSPARRDALDRLCRQYWKPVYAFIRASRREADADDLAQEFFIEMIEGGLLERYSADAGKFRSYLCGALRLFLMESGRRSSALKRGGGRRFFSIDVAEPADDAGTSPEEAFDRHWVRSLLELAVADLANELTNSGREAAFRVFERYELNPPPEGPPSYPKLAAELGIKETDVDNHLRLCRRRMRELVAMRIRDTVGTEADAGGELAALFPYGP